jgi:DNA-directed RNA polymerase alpha subunit
MNIIVPDYFQGKNKEFTIQNFLNKQDALSFAGSIKRVKPMPGFTIIGNSQDAIILFLKTDIKDLGLSIRTTHCLMAAKIKNVAQLIQTNPNDLLKFRNFGKKCIFEIEDTLREKDTSLCFGADISKYLPLD